MCSAIFLRMTPIGTISTRSPGRYAGTWAVALGDGAGRCSRYPRMSCFVTRPATPVPCRPARSTLCSLAIRRTSGDDRVRRGDLDHAVANRRHDAVDRDGLALFHLDLGEHALGR